MKSTILKDQKTAVWRQHIERANQYPEGIQKYCNANGLSIQTYYKWKLKLNSKNKKIPTKLIPSSSFAEVRICKPEFVCKQNLPDAKWLAEFLLHLTEAAQ